MAAKAAATETAEAMKEAAVETEAPLEAKKTTRKRTAKKADAAKEETAAQTAKTVKKRTAAKKAETSEEAPAEAPAKSTRRRTAKKAEPVTQVILEFGGRQIDTAAVVRAAAGAYKEAHADADVTSIEVYIKLEENAAYYVVNGEGSADFRVEL